MEEIIVNDYGHRKKCFTMEKNYGDKKHAVTAVGTTYRDLEFPSGRTDNQINHLIIWKRDMNFIRQVKGMRGAECNPDHCLVKVVCGNKLMREVISKEHIRRVKSSLLKNGEKKKWNSGNRTIYTTLFKIITIITGINHKQ